MTLKRSNHIVLGLVLLRKILIHLLQLSLQGFHSLRKSATSVKQKIPYHTAPRATDPYHTGPAYSKSPSPTPPIVPVSVAHTAAATTVPAPTVVVQPASSVVPRILVAVAAQAFAVVASRPGVVPRVAVAFLRIRVAPALVHLTRNLRWVRGRRLWGSDSAQGVQRCGLSVAQGEPVVLLHLQIHWVGSCG